MLLFYQSVYKIIYLNYFNAKIKIFITNEDEKTNDN